MLKNKVIPNSVFPSYTVFPCIFGADVIQLKWLEEMKFVRRNIQKLDCNGKISNSYGPFVKQAAT